MAEVTTKEKVPEGEEPSRDRRREATLSALSTVTGAVCFLLAFTYLHGTEQLLLASLGALLAGGSR